MVNRFIFALRSSKPKLTAAKEAAEADAVSAISKFEGLNWGVDVDMGLPFGLFTSSRDKRLNFKSDHESK